MDKQTEADEGSSSTADSNKSCNQGQLVWQIKGQYHLTCSDDEDSCGSPHDNHHDMKMERSSEDKSASKSGNSFSVLDPLVSNDDGADISTSLERRRDWEVLKWQTRQEAKAFVDNTINCVLEDMGFVPPLDTEDIMNDGNLEHEAVSMAILSHGLQRSDHDTSTTSSPVVSSNSYSTHKNTRSHIQIFGGLSKVLDYPKYIPKPKTQVEASCSSSSKDVQNSFTNTSSELQITSGNRSSILETENIMTVEHSKSYFIENLQGSGSTSSNPQSDCDSRREMTLNMYSELPIKALTCNLTEKPVTPQEETSLSPLLKRKSEDSVCTESTKRCCHESSPLHSKPELNNILTSSLSGESVSNVDLMYDKAPSFEHFDFMDAAVAVAIQKKGLSAMACTEYG